MAKSQQTFSKIEKEKKRLKKREDKKKKKEARRAEKEASDAPTGIDFVYVDHLGRLVDTPPDPSKKLVDVEDIVLGIPKKEESDEDKFDPVHKGVIDFFDTSKGFGFIIDTKDQQKYFTHISGMIDKVGERDKVTFELEKGQRGMNAVRVKLQKEEKKVEEPKASDEEE